MEILRCASSIGRPGACGEVAADGLGHAELEGIGDQSVTDRNFEHIGNPCNEQRQVVEVKIMSRVDTKPRIDCTSRRRDKSFDRCSSMPACVRGGVWLRVQ